MALRQQRLLHLILGFATWTSLAVAQSGERATQSVTLEVKPVTRISVSDNPAALLVNDAMAGMELLSVKDENSHYSITTNVENMKIVASINQQMPAGTRLMLRLASSKGASAGVVDLSNALRPVDVIHSIACGSDSQQRITYIFTANTNAGEIPQESRTITLTLTN